MYFKLANNSLLRCCLEVFQQQLILYMLSRYMSTQNINVLKFKFFNLFNVIVFQFIAVSMAVKLPFLELRHCNKLLRLSLFLFQSSKYFYGKKKLITL